MLFSGPTGRRKIKAAALVISTLLVLFVLFFFEGYIKKDRDPSKIPENSSKPQSWVSDTPVEFSMIYSEEAFAPYDKNWLLMEEIQKRTNVVLNLQIVPSVDYNEKLQLLVNTGDMPDIISRLWPSSFSDYCLNNVFLPISDYLDKLPNFKNIMEQWDLKDEYNQYVLINGKFYWLPGLYEQPVYNQGFIVREDLVKKYGRDIESFDDLYLFLKAYKAEHPDSYPLTDHGLDCMLHFIGNSWGVQAGWSAPFCLFYNYDTQKYEFLYTSERYKAMLSFLTRLMRENLLDPEITTQTYTSFIQKLSSGKSVATWYYIEPLKSINNEGRKTLSPEFDLRLKPPISGPAGAFTSFTEAKFSGGWMLPAKVADSPNFDKLLQFVDWIAYSEEGYTLTSWGVEGTTYRINNGKKVFVDDIYNSPEDISRTLQLKYGLHNISFSLTRTTEFLMSVLDDDVKPVALEVMERNMNRDLIPIVQLNAEEQEKISLILTTLRDYCTNMEQQFLYGKKSLETDWDEFTAAVEKKGRKDLENIYNSALERMRK